MSKVMLEEPSEKLYFVKRRGMRFEPEREKELRKIRKEEKKAPPKGKIVGKKKLERKFKQRGLTPQGETGLERIAQERAAIRQMREEEGIPSIDTLKERERLRKKALVPTEKARMKVLEGEEALKKAQQAQLEEQRQLAITQLPGLLQQNLTAIRGVAPDVALALQTIMPPGTPAPVPTPVTPTPVPTPVTPPGLPLVTLGEAQLQKVFDKTKKFNGQSSTGQLKKLFNNNAQYDSNIRSLDKISSAQLEKEWQGTRANLSPDFAKEIEIIIAQKKGAGKGLDMSAPKKRGRKPSKPEGQRSASKGGDILSDALAPFFDGGAALRLSLRGLSGDQLQTVHKKLMEGLQPKRKPGRPKGSKNKQSGAGMIFSKKEKKPEKSKAQYRAEKYGEALLTPEMVMKNKEEARKAEEKARKDAQMFYYKGRYVPLSEIPEKDRDLTNIF